MSNPNYQRDPAIWEEAEKALPLKELMRRIGDGPYLEPKAECPFCQAKGGKFAVFTRGGREMFKCHKPGCDGNDAGLSVRYLSLRKNWDIKTAAKEYLRMALPSKFVEWENSTSKKRSSEGREEISDSSADEADAAASAPQSIEEDFDIIEAPEEKRNPWHSLLMKPALVLTAKDAEKLMEKRGFSRETLRLAGIRSNKQEFKPIVESLVSEWDEAVLVEAGIFKAEGGRVWPAGQLCGWGRTGRKEKDTDGEERDEWSPDVEPPLIPYFDAQGTCIYIRPHKGGVKKLIDEALAEAEISDPDEEPLECAAHVYVPPRFAANLAASDGTVILTEGEWKALAVDQCGIPCVACPGIQFIRNPAFKKELVGIFTEYGVRDVVVIFDNEVKDDPAFKNYKADPWKQFDTQLWAEFTMIDLRNAMAANGGSVRVGWLPDEYRIEGKADFDGILAQCVKKEKDIVKGTAKAEKIFRKCVDNASAKPGTELFPSAGRRIIECKLARLFHKPRLLWGGKHEQQLARRFAEMDSFMDEQVDPQLAAAFRLINGRYYERKTCPKEEVTKLKERIKEFDVQIASERAKPKGDRDYEKLRFLFSYKAAAWQRLRGMPEDISNFTLSCEYKLHTATGVERLVRVKIAGSRGHDEKLSRIGGKQLSSIREFRDWCLSVTPDAVWKGGQGALDALCEDLNVQGHRREIHEVMSLGWHSDTGIWFMGDCAAVDGKERSTWLMPDANGLTWHEGVGYRIESQADDSGNFAFTLGVPHLHKPQGADVSDLFEEHELGDVMMQMLYDLSIGKNSPIGAQDAMARLCDPVMKLGAEMAAGKTKPSLDALFAAASMECVPWVNPATQQVQPEGTPLREILEFSLARHLFGKMSAEFYLCIGGYDAWLSMGMVFSYLAAPELVRDFNCAPGLWFSGPFGDGKSDTAATLARILGFAEKSVKLNKNTTAIGIARTLAQYSCLPACVDEFRRQNENTVAIEALFRASTERGISPKGNIKNTTSTTAVPSRTSPLVAGETSSQDAATRSRFLQVSIHKMKRKPGSEAAWESIKQTRAHYYHVGRFILGRRQAFVKEFLTELRAWMMDARAAITHDRVRLTIGVGFCAYKVVAQWLGVYRDAEKFRDYAFEHGKKALSDVGEQVFRYQFWRDVIAGLQRQHCISKKFFSMCEVFIENGKIVAKPKTPMEKRQVCFVAADAVYAEYEKDARGRGFEVSIPLADLRTECQREPWFLGIHRIRVKDKGEDAVQGQGRRYYCWAILMEDMEEDGKKRPAFQFSQDLRDALNWGDDDLDGGDTEVLS